LLFNRWAIISLSGLLKFSNPDWMEAFMPTISPVNTNSSIIQYALNMKNSSLSAEPTKVKPLKPDLSDLVIISMLASEKQQQKIQLAASKKIK
jgi:hypothetical protein